MTIFEINKQIEEFVQNNYDEETGEILNLEELAKLEMLMDSKIENIALYYKNTLALAKSLKEEKAILAERQQKAEKKAESLKELLSLFLGGRKFETAKVAVSYRKSERLVIDDQDKIPITYTTIKMERQPDKARLKEAVKNGIEIEGCHIEQVNNIQVK